MRNRLDAAANPGVLAAECHSLRAESKAKSTETVPSAARIAHASIFRPLSAASIASRRNQSPAIPGAALPFQVEQADGRNAGLVALATKLPRAAIDPGGQASRSFAWTGGAAVATPLSRIHIARRCERTRRRSALSSAPCPTWGGGKGLLPLRRAERSWLWMRCSLAFGLGVTATGRDLSESNAPSRPPCGPSAARHRQSRLASDCRHVPAPKPRILAPRRWRF